MDSMGLAKGTHGVCARRWGAYKFIEMTQKSKKAPKGCRENATK